MDAQGFAERGPAPTTPSGASGSPPDSTLEAAASNAQTLDDGVELLVLFNAPSVGGAAFSRNAGDHSEIVVAENSVINVRFEFFLGAQADADTVITAYVSQGASTSLSGQRQWHLAVGESLIDYIDLTYVSLVDENIQIALKQEGSTTPIAVLASGASLLLVTQLAKLPA